MNKWMVLKKLVAAATIVGILGVVGVAGASYATGATTPAGKTYGTIAKDAGKLDEFKAENLEQKKAILGQRVKAWSAEYCR